VDGTNPAKLTWDSTQVTQVTGRRLPARYITATGYSLHYRQRSQINQK
jgi:hypothetical protein